MRPPHQSSRSRQSARLVLPAQIAEAQKLAREWKSKPGHRIVARRAAGGPQRAVAQGGRSSHPAGPPADTRGNEPRRLTRGNSIKREADHGYSLDRVGRLRRPHRRPAADRLFTRSPCRSRQLWWFCGASALTLPGQSESRQSLSALLTQHICRVLH